jgi:hypothetical protein
MPNESTQLYENIHNQQNWQEQETNVRSNWQDTKFLCIVSPDQIQVEQYYYDLEAKTGDTTQGRIVLLDPAKTTGILLARVIYGLTFHSGRFPCHIYFRPCKIQTNNYNNVE